MKTHKRSSFFVPLYSRHHHQQQCQTCCHPNKESQQHLLSPSVALKAKTTHDGKARRKDPPRLAYIANYGLAIPRTIPSQIANGKFTTSTSAIISIIFFTPVMIPLSWLNSEPQIPLAPTIVMAPMQPENMLTTSDTYANRYAEMD
ncbi:hypothetical protein PTKIN_Ptkin05aG0042500 [Pterospermum kingtungense]